MRIILIPAFLLVICASASILTGCSSTSPTNANVLVRVPSASYKLDDVIRVEVTNLSGSPIYYICQCQIRLQLMDGENVKQSWDVHGFELCNKKVPILLGETSAFQIQPEEIESLAADPSFEPGGEYRFQLDLYQDAECTVLLESESDRLSNRVSITL